MSTLKSNVIEPATGTNLTLGASGDTIDVVGDALQLNTWKDSGGNTLFTSDGSGTLSSINSALNIGGGPTLILSQTASGSSSISFTSDIDSTYDKYMFVFININPVTDGVTFDCNMSTDGGSNYNVTKTTTAFLARHTEAGTGSLAYSAADDIAQGTGYAELSVKGIGNDADESGSGILYLFAPSSTTYVKQFYSVMNCYSENVETTNDFYGGYCNTTSAVNAIRFQMGSGNFDGKIKMYGCR